MPDSLLTIGELSHRTGVAPSALRYYEELGLLHPASRVSGRRRYRRSDVQFVGLILFLRDVGFTLSEMKALIASRSRAPGGWRVLARRKVTELDDRITRAEVARTALEHALRCQHDDVFGCPTFTRILAARLSGVPLERAHSHS